MEGSYVNIDQNKQKFSRLTLFDFSLIFIVITIFFFFAVMKHTRIWLKKYIVCYVYEHEKIIAWVRIRRKCFVDGDITDLRAITSAQFKTISNQPKCDDDIAI